MKYNLLKLSTFTAILLFLTLTVASASQGEPVFHFPASLANPTKAEIDGNALREKEAAAERPDLDPPPINRSREFSPGDPWFGMKQGMKRDLNRLASRLVLAARKDYVTRDELFDCYGFARLVEGRFEGVPNSELPKARLELIRFCEEALNTVPAERPTNSDHAPKLSFKALYERYLEEAILRTSSRDQDVAFVSRFAQKLLAEVGEPSSWDYPEVIHDQNMVLAEIALRRGNLNEACAMLASAGSSPGSPFLTLIGPNCPIVLDLIAEGRREDVVRYLNGISKFWESALVNRWVELLREGQTPVDSKWTLATSGWQSDRRPDNPIKIINIAIFQVKGTTSRSGVVSGGGASVMFTTPAGAQFDLLVDVISQFDGMPAPLSVLRGVAIFRSRELPEPEVSVGKENRRAVLVDGTPAVLSWSLEILHGETLNSAELEIQLGDYRLLLAMVGGTKEDSKACADQLIKVAATWKWIR